MPVVFHGRLHDDASLAAAYSAADVFVAPSLLENLPNTVKEAMACGTPCVAFNQGGMAELVEHERTGYLAQPYETEDLARGIIWVLADLSRHAQLSLQGRRKVEAEFSLDRVAKRYVALYREMLAKNYNSA
jgi:glycosyltransferase involved in cell wall biosynthesis